jgi:hypothetical protein
MPSYIEVRDRRDLIRVITDSLPRSVTYMDQAKAEATADTILRNMKAHGLNISRAKK